MRSRAISALVFGLIFAILFAVISLFFPKITIYQCGGESQIEIMGMMLPGSELCDGGSSETSIGFPFPTRAESNQGSLPPQHLDDSSTNDPELNSLGLLANVLFYWLFGFVFFFIFSRTRNKN